VTAQRYHSSDWHYAVVIIGHINSSLIETLCKELKIFDILCFVDRVEELNDLYSLPNIVRVVKSKRMRWAGHVACMGEERGVHRVLMGKPEGKNPLGRPRRRWEDNIKMDFRKLEVVVGSRWSWIRIGTGGGHL
jgi:hypothetical protein